MIHIFRLYQEFPEMEALRRLLSVPGVGEKTVHVLVALLVRWTQLGRRDARGLVAYLGLDPRVCQSGRRPPWGPISKRGDRRWHSLLVAAARKIVVWAWAVYWRGEFFDPRRHGVQA